MPKWLDRFLCRGDTADVSTHRPRKKDDKSPLKNNEKESKNNLFEIPENQSIMNPDVFREVLCGLPQDLKSKGFSLQLHNAQQSIEPEDPYEKSILFPPQTFNKFYQDILGVRVDSIERDYHLPFKCTPLQFHSFVKNNGGLYLYDRCSDNSKQFLNYTVDKFFELNKHIDFEKYEYKKDHKINFKYLCKDDEYMRLFLGGVASGFAMKDIAYALGESFNNDNKEFVSQEHIKFASFLQGQCGEHSEDYFPKSKTIGLESLTFMSTWGACPENTKKMVELWNKNAKKKDFQLYKQDRK